MDAVIVAGVLLAGWAWSVRVLCQKIIRVTKERDTARASVRPAMELLAELATANAARVKAEIRAAKVARVLGKVWASRQKARWGRALWLWAAADYAARLGERDAARFEADYWMGRFKADEHRAGKAVAVLRRVWASRRWHQDHAARGWRAADGLLDAVGGRDAVVGELKAGLAASRAADAGSLGCLEQLSKLSV